MTPSKIFRNSATLLLVFAMSILAACGGTKVYTADKNVVYRDSIYNLASVQQITTRKEAKLPDGEVVALDNKKEEQLETFFETNPGSMVSMYFVFDERDMLYLRMKVENYREYERLEKRLEKAMKDVMKFMGDKKKTQLKLG